MDLLKKKLDKFKRKLPKKQSQAMVNSIIEQVYDKDYYWLESEKVTTFNKALEEFNATIANKREKFVFSQNIIKSIFELTKLKEIVDDWCKDSFSPENLDHLHFIHSGLLAYSCLEKIPKDILMDLKLLDWCPIHHGYFSGHLAKFVKEIKGYIDLKRDLIKIYRSDRYLFENLNRIINSLKNFLEFNVDELYVEKTKAAIARNLPKNFVVVASSNELTLRNPKKVNQVYASLPLDKQLMVLKIEVIRALNSTYVIAINARNCFYWNPEQDLTAHYFYKASENERIIDVFSQKKDDDSIETIIQIEQKLIIFNDFQFFKSNPIELNLQLIPYNSGFVGITDNHVLSCGALVYQVSEDFQLYPKITIESVRAAVKDFEEIKDWLKSFNSDMEISSTYDLQNIRLKKITGNGEDLILLIGSVNKTGVCLLVRLTDNGYEILNILHLKESISISIDFISNGDNLELFCAYLDMKRKDSVFEYIKLQNFKTVETKTITRRRKDSSCRDIEEISVGDNGLIYLNEMRNRILVYSPQKDEFEEFNFEENRIYSLKYSS